MLPGPQGMPLLTTEGHGHEGGKEQFWVTNHRHHDRVLTVCGRPQTSVVGTVTFKSTVW